MSRQIKELMIKEYEEKFSDLGERGCVVVQYQGLGANATNDVRMKLSEHESNMFVVRNRLIALSLEKLGYSDLKSCLNGPAAMIMGPDPVKAAKAVNSVREDFPSFTVLGGYAEGKVLNEPAVSKLADIPDRDVLLSQTIALISSPAQKLANALNNTINRLALVLNQIKEKKESESQ